jgi:sugar/nucleoside kinase (ribokinase family)
MRPVAVIGNLASDVVDGGRPRVGGGPYYAARALRLLGRPARIVTKLAARDRDVLLPPLVALGVPVTWRQAASTARFAIDYDGESRRMLMEEVGEPWTPDDVDGWAAAALRPVEWLQLAPLAQGEFPAETLAALARGRRLLLDGQGLVRCAQTGPLEVAPDADPALLRHLTVLKLAEEEAAALVGGADEAALRGLGVPEVVVTLGSRGALLLADGRLTPVPTRAVVPSVDPTGAGDAFAAGYVSARNAGQAPLAAAHRANAVARALLEGRTT